MPNIDSIEAPADDLCQSAPSDAQIEVANQQALLRNAVQSRYFAYVEGGSSPNSAAASAIRDVGANKGTLLSGELNSSDVSSDCAPRHLSFDPTSDPTSEEEPIEDERHVGRMQQSSSAPTLSAAAGLGGTGRDTAKQMARTRDSPQPTGHRNKDVWKTFGIHMPAGRLLKNLYGGGKVDLAPVSLKQSLPRRAGPPSELDTYMAINSMKLSTPGLQYCKSMNIFDVCQKEFVRWGDSVEGYRVDASWLQVGDRYLPTIVNRVQMLKKWHGSEALRAEGLSRQQTLPPLRKLPRERSCPQLSVGGKAYGF